MPWYGIYKQCIILSSWSVSFFIQEKASEKETVFIVIIIIPIHLIDHNSSVLVLGNYILVPQQELEYYGRQDKADKAQMKINLPWGPHIYSHW